MIFGSLFSGIEAASVAWLPLGWRCAWVAEIDPFASAVLRDRYPQVPNLGDVNEIEPGAIEPVDLVVFGSPCQSFSVAGKRLGLDDPRGNMALVGLRLVGKLRPRWVVWENVPGILSSDGGRDFGAFLGLLGELGYGFAYRVLDAQHFGVPQRRRRIFVVGCLGDWRPAAAVLFEPESLRGDSPPSREAGERIAGCLEADANRTGGPRPPGGVAIAYGLRSDLSRDGKAKTPSADAEGRMGLRDPGFNILEEQAPTLDATGPHAVACGGNTTDSIDIATTCNAHGRLDFGCLQHKGLAATGNEAGTLLQQAMSVRRLTPIECERLQGLPDDWTLVPYRGKPAADGPRYRAIGNSMAVPVVRWLGERIQAFEDATAISEAAE